MTPCKLLYREKVPIMCVSTLEFFCIKNLETWYTPDLIQAYKIRSDNKFLQNELKQIEKEFIKINGYPKWVFDQVNVECKPPRNADYDNNVTTNNASISITHRLIPPYKDEQGHKLLSQLTIASKDYYQKTMHQNTYVKVKNIFG